jgi:L-ascorbate metabolism protein UlaG (beta-lactamase superfamily)
VKKGFFSRDSWQKSNVKSASRRKWTERNFITEVLLPSFFIKRGGRPQKPIFPKLSGNQISITWIGHASFLIQTAKHNLIIDPNWNKWVFVVKRLREAGIAIADLPMIDLVLVTHAHFDHLSRRSLKQIAARQPIVIPQGVRNLVHDLGFDRIHEMLWWESLSYKGLKITFTPAKHWGARVITDRFRGYGGFAIEYEGRVIYHCGDSALFDGFEEIGRRLKPEIALLPIGAYDPPSGRDHHMNPEEAMEVFKILKAKTFIPMHYGSYRMSYEPMHEPEQRLLSAAAEGGMLNQVRFLIEGQPQVF